MLRGSLRAARQLLPGALERCPKFTEPRGLWPALLALGTHLRSGQIRSDQGSARWYLQALWQGMVSTGSGISPDLFCLCVLPLLLHVGEVQLPTWQVVGQVMAITGRTVWQATLQPCQHSRQGTG